MLTNPCAEIRLGPPYDQAPVPPTTLHVILDPTVPQTGLSGFTSWRRLAEILRHAGELAPTERVVGYQVNGRGITFVVEDKPTALTYRDLT
jgi:hypothetical protein